jgi:hypothetical protein
MAILNKQKYNWAWRERVYYVYADGTIYELAHWYKKGGYNYYIPPLEKGNVVARIVCKSKVNHTLTIQTGELHYNKNV